MPVEWDVDAPLYFHVSEHSRKFEFTVYDASTFAAEPFGRYEIDLQPMVAKALYFDDREVDWADDNLDDLLNIKSLNPLNAIATMNKSIQEAEKLAKIAYTEAEKAKNFAIEQAENAAAMALDTVGFDSAALLGIASDGAETYPLELKDADGNLTCTLMVQLRFHTKEWVPDWNFIAEFGDDNPTLKPRSCGIEGWIDVKDGNKSSYDAKWMFITKDPPALCIMDVGSEMELRQMMRGKQGKIPEELITRIAPHEIHQLRNGFSRRRQKDRKFGKARHAKEEDCQFEFTTVNEIDHSKTGLHDGTNSAGRRHGVLHVRVIEARGLPHMDGKGDTDGYCILEMEGVTHKTSVEEDTIVPEWDQSFSFSVFNQEDSILIISVWDEDPHSQDDIIGKISLSIADLEENQSREDWHDVRIVKLGPPKSQWSGESPKTLGQVRLAIKWAGAENAEVLLQQWTEDDLMMNRIKVSDNQMRYRAASPEVKYTWLQAIAWVERGGTGHRPAGIAAPAICDEDMQRVENNPSTVDMPISVCRHLLYNLRAFKCLGLKEGRDASMYATFQLELHAWKKKYHDQGKKKKKIIGGGAAVDSFHGLDFALTLTRLCLLKYGKASSLPYFQMMEEYEYEKVSQIERLRSAGGQFYQRVCWLLSDTLLLQAHTALHTIQTCLLAWIYNRRGTYEGQDTRRAIHPMWHKGHDPDAEIVRTQAITAIA